MVVTIHQPEFLPWSGFLDKAAQADLFVLLDHVPFRKHYFQNRNRIRTSSGSGWIVVPIHSSGRPSLNEVTIANEQMGWSRKIWRSIEQSYGRSPHFEDHAGFFRAVFETRWERLVDLNEALIRYLFQEFGIGSTIAKSSELDPRGRKGDLIFDLVVKTGASAYLSGRSGRDYLDLSLFASARIDVRFQEFFHPIYEQRYRPFIPGMSCIDLLFQHGSASLETLRGKSNSRIQSVFE